MNAPTSQADQNTKNTSLTPPNNHVARSPTKESEPFAPRKQELIVQEVVEHEVKDTQVTPHVEVRKDVPEIPPDLKKVGITTSASSSFQTQQTIKLPLTEDKLPTALKSPLSESIRWLGELTFYLLEQTHGKVKTVHRSYRQKIERFINKYFGQ